MNAAGIQSGLVGMALFDAFESAVKKSHKSKGGPAALVAAAGDAFEAYIETAQIGMAGKMAGLTSYALNAGGGSAQLISGKDMAPFLALNVMA